MRWNCPHCGVALAISDNKLGTGWSFSRCYQCSGFALVRRTDINLVKVDKAPVGENVILPEASEEPMLSRQATLNLKNRPSIRPPESRGVSLPTPLPENPVAQKPRRFLSAAMGAAATVAIGSGIYLYQQGQTIWTQVRGPVQQAVAPVPVNEAASAPQLVSTAATTLTDQLRSEALAPTLAENEAAPLAVRTISQNVKLRSGPGIEFPIVGLANPNQPYPVTGWNERWFKIDLGHSKTAWVRNDLVRSVQSGN